MKRFAMAATLGTGLLLSAWQVDAQWRHTDDRGTSKVTQYKIDVPAPYRDTAEWIGPIAAQLWNAVRRIVAAEAGLLQFKNVQAPRSPRWDSGAAGKPMATMCIAGELRAMTSPGSSKVVGACGAGFSTGYGTDGYGSFGGFSVR